MKTVATRTRTSTISAVVAAIAAALLTACGSSEPAHTDSAAMHEPRDIQTNVDELSPDDAASMGLMRDDALTVTAADELTVGDDRTAVVVATIVVPPAVPNPGDLIELNLSGTCSTDQTTMAVDAPDGEPAGDQDASESSSSTQTKVSIPALLPVRSDSCDLQIGVLFAGMPSTGDTTTVVLRR